MPRLSVEAAGSPLFDDFLFVVSVSDADGAAVTGLDAGDFEIHRLASLNHASDKERTVKEVAEGPDGFYRVQLQSDKVQPDLPPGHYVFAVIVRQPSRLEGESAEGRTVAVGDLPE